MALTVLRNWFIKTRDLGLTLHSPHSTLKLPTPKPISPSEDIELKLKMSDFLVIKTDGRE